MELLARRLDQWFLHDKELEGLDPEVRWIISAANMITGVRFTFERDVLGDYTIGLTPTADSHLRVSLAVAASAAVPGAFAPMVINQVRFPCATQPPVLLDGGTYDNTGLEALDGERYRKTFLLTLNAGGLLRPGSYGKVPLVRDLARANSLLYRQSTALRTRDMVNRFDRGRSVPTQDPVPPGARRGVLVGLATDFPEPGPELLRAWRDRHPEHRTFDGKDLSLVPTVFDKLDEKLCRALIYRGWWLMGAALAVAHLRRRRPDPRLRHRLPDHPLSRRRLHGLRQGRRQTQLPRFPGERRRCLSTGSPCRLHRPHIGVFCANGRDRGAPRQFRRGAG